MLKFAGDWDELQNNYSSFKQSRAKFIKQWQEIKQNWTVQEKLKICFCIIFEH